LALIHTFGEDNRCGDFLTKTSSHVEMISLAMANKIRIHGYPWIKLITYTG